MKEYVLKVPSSQQLDDWFRFVSQSMKNTDDVDFLIVDFNEVRFMETDDFVI